MNEKQKLWVALAFVAGLCAGMLIIVLIITFQTENIISNILGHIQIENINFDLNETELVDGMARYIG